MRKSLTLFFAIALSVGALACNQNTPGWGHSLGTITFDSQGHNVMIQGNGITQIWSGAVTATACQKTTFFGAPISNDDFPPNADCRSNPGFPGDLFSGCAVVRFANQLCPFPWRVPTGQDFFDLDIAMGGTGKNRGADTENAQFIIDNYIGRWGGAFGGRSFVNSSNFTNAGMSGQGTVGSYWSLSESARNGIAPLFFESIGTINIQHYLWAGGGGGVSLRCVRAVGTDNEIVSLWDRALAVSNPQNLDQLRNATYRWYRNDVLLPQSSGYWIDVGSPIPAGRYSVSVHYAGAEILFLERTFSQPFGVLASPNPINISDELTVEAYGATIERIEVFDMNGALLNTIVGNKSVVGFNTPGIHILRIHLDNQTIETLRIIVQ